MNPIAFQKSIITLKMRERGEEGEVSQEHGSQVEGGPAGTI